MAPAELSVLAIRSPSPGEIDSHSIRMPASSTVGDLLQALGWTLGEAEAVGLWGRKVGLQEPLRDGDRVEVYRPLTVDPMRARHRRHALQGGRRIVSRHRPAGPR